FVERALRALASHVADSVTDASVAMSEAGKDRGEPREPEIPPEVQRQVLGDFYVEHYKKWLDEPIPALGGETPRRAARTRAGRRRVDELLKDAENRVPLQPGAERVDFRQVRRELGLER